MLEGCPVEDVIIDNHTNVVHFVCKNIVRAAVMSSLPCEHKSIEVVVEAKIIIAELSQQNNSRSRGVKAQHVRSKEEALCMRGGLIIET